MSPNSGYFLIVYGRADFNSFDPGFLQHSDRGHKRVRIRGHLVGEAPVPEPDFVEMDPRFGGGDVFGWFHFLSFTAEGTESTEKENVIETKQIIIKRKNKKCQKSFYRIFVPPPIFFFRPSNHFFSALSAVNNSYFIMGILIPIFFAV